MDTYGVRILGTGIESIRKGEDREIFKRTMMDIGEPVIESTTVCDTDSGLAFAERIGYPVVVRPAYTLGGATEAWQATGKS